MEKRSELFWDASLPIEKRLDVLLSEMTIEEKLDCLSSAGTKLERLGVPAMALGGEAAHGVEARNDQNELGEPEPTTSFVQPIGMSATWDPELIRKAGVVTGTEARVIYHRHPDRGLSRWAPTVDLERDPRWGRTEEGYGEDPVLTGEMASAYVRGMQGEDPKYLRIAATLKHFYGNNTEEGRGWKNSSIDPRNKYELYLEPFRRVIQKGRAEAVMTAYNKINGTPGMLNHEVQWILKDQYGLKHAVSDGGAMALVAGMHHYYGTDAETVANAVKAGVDGMSDNPEAVGRAAREAWELGLLTEEEIDRALRNMYSTRLRLGIYDRSNANPYDRVTEADLDSEENRAVCEQVSREAIVLLKNEGMMLPLELSGDREDIALIGPMGDAWYQDWYGGEPPFRKTLREGIDEIADVSVPFADGLDRVVFHCRGKGLAVDRDGSLCLSSEPDVFIKQDWGEGSITLRCERTGKYMNARLYHGPEAGEAPGRIAVEKDSMMDWFVMEVFHISEQEDGSVILSNHLGSPVVLEEDGSLWSMREGEPVRFWMEEITSGTDTACKLAAERKKVILALGCNSMINARETTDRGTIAMPPEQEKLLEAVYQVNPNIVLVLLSNYPYSINAAKEKLPAILWSATGAQDMGTAVAQTLFGVNAPAGRLNLTWYCDDSQLPDIDDYDIIKGKRTYRYFDGEVLYPFGHGLTYTEFAYSDLEVRVEDRTMLEISFAVTNIGDRVSDEVAQVYGKAPASRIQKPVRQLLGFSRLKNVKPGETRMVRICVSTEEFRFYDVISRRLMVEAGQYTIYAGSSSAQTPLSAQIELTGEKTGLRDMSVKTAADHYDDYENIELREGKFGYCAVAVKDLSRKGELIYRDCKIQERPSGIALFLKCEKGGSVRVLSEGKELAYWHGDTRVYEKFSMPAMGEKAARDAMACRATWQPLYTEVMLTFPEDVDFADTAAEIRIELTGDVRLCYFKLSV